MLKVNLVLIFMLCVGIFTKVSDAKEWRSQFFQDHPLVAKIWDSHKQSLVNEQEFYRELLEYDYILLGETHNNPDHHQLQSQILNYFSLQNRKTQL